MKEKIIAIFRNRELSHIIDVMIIGLTLLDVIVLTGTYFIKVSPETYNIVLIFDLALCIILITQFIYNFYKSPDKSEYIKHNWFNILGMVPEILIGGYATFLRYFRLIKILSLFRKNLIHFFEFIEKTHLEYGIITIIFILISGAAIFYFFEFGINQNVNSLDDAIWYVLITITTVGFGDIYPQTIGGRIATVIIIVAGIGFISYVAAGLTGWFLESSTEKEKELEEKLDKFEKKIDKKFDDLESELREIKEMIETIK